MSLPSAAGAVLLAASLLLSSAPAAATSPWRTDTADESLTYVPAEISFPLRIESLARESHTFGQNPYTPDAASVSYGAVGRAVVVVTLIPTRDDPAGTAGKLFAARKSLFLDQHPGAVATSPPRPSCETVGPKHRLAVFDLQSTRESLYATSLVGHVLYVRSTEARQEKIDGLGHALGAFLLKMGWPCR